MILGVALLVLASSPAWTDPQIRFRPVATVTMTVLSVDSGVPATLQVRVDPDDGGSGGLELDWPGRDDRTRITLTLRDESDTKSPQRLLDLRATIERDGESRELARKWTVEDGSTRLLELDRADERPLTVGLGVSIDEEPFVPRVVVVGRPVRFVVEIERWVGGKGVSLESNTLDTFLDQSVSYAFTLGGGEGLSASLQLELTPVSVVEQLLATEVQVSGRLSDGAGQRIVGRRERVLASSRQPSRIAAEPPAEGEPFDGYVFVVTAEF